MEALTDCAPVACCKIPTPATAPENTRIEAIPKAPNVCNAGLKVKASSCASEGGLGRFLETLSSFNMVEGFLLRDNSKAEGDVLGIASPDETGKPFGRAW